jgi:putative transposase
MRIHKITTNKTGEAPMKKIRPSEIKSKQLQELLSTFSPEEGLLILEEFQKLGQEKILQEALEAEVDTFLGRRWHKSSEEKGEDFTGYRNGYYPRQIRVPGSKLQIMVPKVRQTKTPFSSRILKGCLQLTEKLHRLVLEMYVRGLSTRDIEEVFRDNNGNALLGKSAVSQLTERLYEEYEAFARRDLSSFDVIFLFVDGVYEAVRNYTNGQALLCAWAICSDGTKQIMHLAPVQSESEEAWQSFFDDMLQRKLRQPLLVVSDGAPGLVSAIERSFPKADRQRCIAHKLRNIMAKLPKDIASRVLPELKAVYYATDKQHAELLAAKIIDSYASVYPAAVKCFSDDLPACLTHLKYPEGHRRYIRTTNLLERTFEEEKRRTKVMPQHQHEKGAVGLVFAVLWRASLKWQHVTMEPLELAQLRAIRTLICPNDHSTEFISYQLAA